MKILVTRKDEKYRNALTEHEVAVVETLRTEYLDQSELRDLLLKPTEYTGLVVTSQRVVECLRVEMDSSWKQLPVFCTGPATFDCISKIGLNAVAGSRNAQELLEFIQTNHSGRLLFLTGDKTRDTLKQICDSFQVYRTVTEPMICNGYDVIVYTSPSSVDAISTDCARAIAIGPTTHKRLLDRGIVSEMALEPTPEGVRDALLRMVAGCQE
jgi:uroporphyrinogen-III synthase